MLFVTFSKCLCDQFLMGGKVFNKKLIDDIPGTCFASNTQPEPISSTPSMRVKAPKCGSFPPLHLLMSTSRRWSCFRTTAHNQLITVGVSPAEEKYYRRRHHHSQKFQYIDRNTILRLHSETSRVGLFLSSQVTPPSNARLHTVHSPRWTRCIRRQGRHGRAQHQSLHGAWYCYST